METTQVLTLKKIQDNIGLLKKNNTINQEDANKLEGLIAPRIGELEQGREMSGIANMIYRTVNRVIDNNPSLRQALKTAFYTPLERAGYTNTIQQRTLPKILDSPSNYSFQQ